MSPEFKKLMGRRQSDDDGFTYVYGKHKGGRSSRTRNRSTTARCIRNDKRSIKSAGLKRALVDQ